MATVEIRGDDSPLRKTLAHTSAMLSQWAASPITAISTFGEKKVSGMLGGTSFKSMMGAFARFTFPTFGGLAAFSIIETGVEKFIHYGKEALSVAEQLELSFIRLNSVLEQTGNKTNITMTEMTEMTEFAHKRQLQPMHEAVESLERLSRMENIKGDIFRRAMKVAPDLAIALERPMSEAAKALAIALQNPVHGMLRLHLAGIKTTETEKQNIAMLQGRGEFKEAKSALLDIVERKVGGVAIRSAQTPGGQLKSFGLGLEAIKIKVGESLERILVTLIPAFKLGADIFAAAVQLLIPALESFAYVFGKLAESLNAWIWLADKIINRFAKDLGAVDAGIEKLLQNAGLSSGDNKKDALDMHPFIIDPVYWLDYFFPKDVGKGSADYKRRGKLMDDVAKHDDLWDYTIKDSLKKQQSVAGTFEAIEAMWFRINSAASKPTVEDAILEEGRLQAGRDDEQLGAIQNLTSTIAMMPLTTSNLGNA